MSTNVEDLSEVHCNYIIGVCLCFNENPPKTSRFLFSNHSNQYLLNVKNCLPKRDVIIKHNIRSGSVYWMAPFCSNTFLHLGVYSQISFI